MTAAADDKSLYEVVSSLSQSDSLDALLSPQIAERMTQCKDADTIALYHSSIGTSESEIIELFGELSPVHNLYVQAQADQILEERAAQEILSQEGFSSQPHPNIQRGYLEDCYDALSLEWMYYGINNIKGHREYTFFERLNPDERINLYIGVYQYKRLRELGNKFNLPTDHDEAIEWIIGFGKNSSSKHRTEPQRRYQFERHLYQNTLLDRISEVKDEEKLRFYNGLKAPLSSSIPLPGRRENGPRIGIRDVTYRNNLISWIMQRINVNA